MSGAIESGEFQDRCLRLFHNSEVLWDDETFQALSVVRNAADDFAPEWDEDAQYWVDEAGLLAICRDCLPALKRLAQS